MCEGEEDEGTRTSLIEIGVKNKDLVLAVVALGVKVTEVMVLSKISISSYSNFRIAFFVFSNDRVPEFF